MKGEIYGVVWEKPILDTMELAMCHIRAVCGIRQAIQLVDFSEMDAVGTSSQGSVRLADRL